MMIFKNDNETYIIPFDNFSHNSCLVYINEKERLLNCLETINETKKNSNFTICDDEGIIINKKDINYINLISEESVDANFDIKSKSFVHNCICNFINNNLKDFESIEKIRNEMFDFENDSGIVKINKILSKGLDDLAEIKLNEFNINTIIQMLHIDCNNSSYVLKKLAIYNLLLYLSRDKINIIYIDNNYDYTVEKWIKSLDTNIYTLIDNSCVNKYVDGYDLLILNNSKNIIKDDLRNDEIGIISYMLKPLIQENIDLQKEKFVDLYNNFVNNEATFFLKNKSTI